jgi:hypothetical protein
MSTVFYIIDKRKKDEYKNFCDILNNYKEKLQNDLLNYVNNVNGILINEENLAWDIEKKTKDFIESLKYCIDEDEIRFGQVGSRGFTFFQDHTCRNLGCYEDVEKLLKENTNFIINDEYNIEYSLEEFKEIVKLGIIPEKD